VRYQIASWGSNVDIFVYDSDNYLWYVEDQSREVPYNWGYLAVRSMLNVDNADQTASLVAGKQYYLVIDHTPVGAANGNNNNGEFTQVDFQYHITGAEVEGVLDPISTAGAFTIIPGIASLLAVVAALLALL